HGHQPFPSLSGSREKSTSTRAFRHIGTRPPGRWGNARRSTAPAPQSKPVTPASRLVAHVAPSVASGLGLRILAAGPAVCRLYSYRGRLHEPDPKQFARASPRARGSADALPAAGLVSRERAATNHRARPTR